MEQTEHGNVPVGAAAAGTWREGAVPRLVRLCAALGLCCATFAAGAAAPAGEAPPSAQATQGVVNVTGTKDPEMRSYRSVARGLDAFDEHRRLAPAAQLRFRFAHKLPKNEAGSVNLKLEAGLPATEADGLALRLAGDDLSIPIPIDADGRFTIARSQAAHDADATFILNRKSGLFTYHPDIRTPGLPENVRRLGDLRLECYVAQAIAKDDVPLVARLFITSVLRTGDWCGKEKFSTGFPAYGQLARVTLRDGNRRGTFYFDSGSYWVPVGPGAFSDDALIELEYAATTTASPDVAQAGSGGETVAPARTGGETPANAR
jgi:hypothetical protein